MNPSPPRASTKDRKTFQVLTAVGVEDDVACGLGAQLKLRSDPMVGRALAAIFLHVAIAAPERLRAIYDAASEGYRGEPVAGASVPIGEPQPPELVPPTFWPALWALVESPRRVHGALNIVSGSAMLAELASPGAIARSAKAAMVFPGVAGGFSKGYPRPFSTEALARCSRGSLGAQFHQLVAVSGADPAVLDRDQQGLEDLPPPLSYLGARIRQCNGLWQLVGGYEFTALHEAAILGFQLAQCRHPPVAMRIATMFAVIAFERPEGATMMMGTLLDAWIHGRRTPSLLGVNWPAVWNQPVERVRAKLKVSPFVSTFPPKIFEEAAGLELEQADLSR